LLLPAIAILRRSENAESGRTRAAAVAGEVAGTSAG
jgi:hypothetical protein